MLLDREPKGGKTLTECGRARRTGGRSQAAIAVSKLIAKPPAVAGEPLADLMLSTRDRQELNGGLFKLEKRVEKPDKAMNDTVLGRRLWDELAVLTRPTQG